MVYSQCTEAFHVLFETSGGWGPCGPKSSKASHVKRLPSSSLLRFLDRVEDTFPSVEAVTSNLSVLMVSLFMYHVTVRFWIGATSLISHCSSSSLPSITDPLLSTVMSVGLSIKINVKKSCCSCFSPASVFIQHLLTVHCYLEVFAAFVGFV